MTIIEVPNGEDLWTALVHLQGFSPRTRGSFAFHAELRAIADVVVDVDGASREVLEA